MNEEKKIKEKYFDNNTYLQAFTKKQAEEILEILYNIQQYGDENKGPDLISKTKNMIYGIEHFEFDCTKNDKKGSRYKQQIGLIDNKVNEDIKSKTKVKNTSVLTLNQNIQNYIQSYKKVFGNHYLKIQSYLDYLNNDFPHIKKEMWFFIEDVTPFGTHYLNEKGEPEIFNPMLSKELIELFENSPSLNGIMFAVSTYSKEKSIYVFTNNTQEISFLKRICDEKSVNNLMVQNPLCVTTFVKIENKKELNSNE